MTATPATLSEVRCSVYATGELPRADGSTLRITPHTPHPEDGDALRDIVLQQRPGSTLEIGCATGLSSLAILEGVMSSGMTPRHTAIDPYASAEWGGAARLLFERTGVDHLITMDERESVVVLSQWLAEGRTFDLAFVDGCHWFECALIDIVLLARLIKAGGTIIVDDVWMPAVRDAIAYATANLNVTHMHTHTRNGRPRLSVLRVDEIDANRAWDSYIAFNQ